MSWFSDFLFGKKVGSEPVGSQFSEIAEAYKKYGPALFEGLSEGQRQQAALDFELQNKYAPQYIEQEQALADKYGAGLANTEANINAVVADRAAALEQQLIKQYGPETAKAILAASESADPRGTAARQTIKELFDTYTSKLSPELNGSELAAISRSQAQENPNQVGSNLETVRNAMTFGKAGADKLASFGQAAAQAASLLPAISSNVNPFSVSTLGRGADSGTQSMIDKITGKNYNNSAEQQASINQLFGIQGQRNDIAALNRDRGFLQAWTRGTEGLKNLAGAAAGFAAACFIAREVFGAYNPEWLLFRSWLYNSAPDRLRTWYIKNGEKVAGWIHARPATKQRLLKLMRNKIYGT